MPNRSTEGEDTNVYDPNGVLSDVNRSVEDYTRGEYMMLAPAIVTEDIDRQSKKFPQQLEPGDKINIVQIRLLEDRIRGKLKRGGWISIAHVTVENWVWAEKRGTLSESSPKPYLGMVEHNSNEFLAAVFPTEGETCNVTIMESEEADKSGLVGTKLFDVSSDKIKKLSKEEAFSTATSFADMMYSSIQLPT